MAKLPQIEDREKTFIDFVATDLHLVNELHILLAPVIELVVFTRVAHITRFTYDKLTEVVNESTLSTFEQTKQ